MKKAQVIVTSCSRRGLEVEQVKTFLAGNGYVLSKQEWSVDGEADVVVLSTCGFTQAAENFGFETLTRIQQHCKPGATVVLGGCIPEINPGRAAREFGGPVYSPQSYGRLNDILQAERSIESFPRPNTFQERGSDLATGLKQAANIIQTFDGSLSGLAYITHRLSNGARQRLIQMRFANLYNPHTFYIQIQEGCCMSCSYCAIRLAIGGLRSKPLDQIMAEFKDGLRQGYRHFQLMGDNAGSYGQDIGCKYSDLLARIVALQGKFEVDLTDINPVYLPRMREAILAFCQAGRAASLYVPIQSASRRILKQMRRDCDLEEVKQALIEIRKAAPRLKMGTSLIAGFPSETMEDLAETVVFCREVGFNWVWCHSYSARPGSPSTDLPEQIAAEEIHRRARWVRSELKGQAIVTTAEDTRGSKTCQG